MTAARAPILVALALIAATGGCSPSNGDDAATGATTNPVASTDDRPIRPNLPMARDCGGIDVPVLKGRVSDPANLIPDADETLLEQHLAQYQARTGHEAVAVMLPTLNGKDDGLVARCLGDSWSIGDEVRQDGVMLMLVPSEERVRVAMGSGFGNAEESNRKAQQVIDGMMPSLRRGDMVGGLKEGAQSLSRILP